jgi:hypothetical protein
MVETLGKNCGAIEAQQKKEKIDKKQKISGLLTHPGQNFNKLFRGNGRKMWSCQNFGNMLRGPRNLTSTTSSSAVFMFC